MKNIDYRQNNNIKTDALYVENRGEQLRYFIDLIYIQN